MSFFQQRGGRVPRQAAQPQKAKNQGGKQLSNSASSASKRLSVLSSGSSWARNPPESAYPRGTAKRCSSARGDSSTAQADFGLALIGRPAAASYCWRAVTRRGVD